MVGRLCRRAHPLRATVESNSTWHIAKENRRLDQLRKVSRSVPSAVCHDPIAITTEAVTVRGGKCTMPDKLAVTAAYNDMTVRQHVQGLGATLRDADAISVKAP